MGKPWKLVEQFVLFGSSPGLFYERIEKDSRSSSCVWTAIPIGLVSEKDQYASQSLSVQSLNATYRHLRIRDLNVQDQGLPTA